MNEKDNAEKLEALRAACVKNPDDREAAVQLAQFYVDLGWLNEAMDLYRELLKTIKDDYTLLLDYGNLCFRKQEHGEALKTFKCLTLLRPRRIEGWNNLGIVYLTLKKEEEARTAFAHVLELEPENPGALLNMGNYHHRKGDAARAIELFERAVKVSPDFADGWFNLGNACRETGDSDKAVHAYARALRYNPEYCSALKNLGLVYEEKGDLDKAEEHYRKALAINRADASLYINLANVYTRRQRPEEAKEFYLKAVKLAPRDPSGWMGLRELSLVKGDIAAYVRATQAVIGHLDSTQVAQTCRKLRELGHAAECATIIKQADALGLSGESLDAQRLLVYRKQEGRRGMCLALEKKLASLAPRTAEISEALAAYYAADGAFGRALDVLEPLEEKSRGGHLLYWNALIEAGRADDAEHAILAYLKSNPDSFEGWFQLARINSRRKNHGMARTSLLKALENGFTDLDAVREDPLLAQILDDVSKE